MLQYGRIDISKGVDVIKRMWYLLLLLFKDVSFKYEPYLCNGCHDLMQKTMSFMLNVKCHMLKEMLTKFIFGIWAKMMQLT